MTKRCCCGIFSHKTGAMLVASSMIVYDIAMMVFEFVVPPSSSPSTSTELPPNTGVVSSVGFSLKAAIIGAIESVVLAEQQTPSFKIASIVAFVLDIIATAQVFIGCRKNRSILIVPMLIITVLWIILDAYTFLCHLAVLIDPSILKDLKTRSTGLPIGVKTLFWAVAVVFFIWIFTVVKDCYIHLREIERPRRRNNREGDSRGIVEPERTTRF